MFLQVQSSSNMPKLRSSLRLWYYSINAYQPRLHIGFQKQKGRSTSTGIKLTLSKGSNKHRNVHRLINASFSGFFVTALLIGYQKFPQKSIPTVFGLFYNAVGCWFYFIAASSMGYLGYCRMFSSTYLVNTPYLTWGWPSILRQLSPHTRICLLSYYTNAQIQLQVCNARLVSRGGVVKFMRASGVSGLLLSPVFFRRWSLVLMPSKKFKIVANDLFACLGFVQPGFQDKLPICKAGFNINRGYAATVRGTVKNANDHPNGGRCRSLRCSYTPWGLVAKKSRTPRGEKKFS